jgi:hypothetical protein
MALAGEDPELIGTLRAYPRGAPVGAGGAAGEDARGAGEDARGAGEDARGAGEDACGAGEDAKRAGEANGRGDPLRTTR